MAVVKKPPETDFRRSLVVLVAACAVLFGIGLGGRDLWAPDEPRYAAIAEELRSFRHGPRGLVLLHLNDAPYDQKPPLYFWLAALAGLPSGRVDELAARLPSALAGVASVAATFVLARLFALPSAAGWLAAGLLGTSFRFAFTARRAQLDVLLCAFELAAVVLFVVLETRRGGARRARSHPGLLALMHASLGAAALVKGPVGWLPMAVFAGFLALERRGSQLRALVPAWSWLLSVGPLALWLGACIALGPEGFFRGAVGTNVFERFFAGSSHARPFYYYAYQLPLDFLPWSLLWPLALPALASAARREPADRGWDHTTTARFLATWILVALVFFTLSAGKRGLYLLPIFPALALATVLGLRLGVDRPGGGNRRIRALAVAIGAAAALEVAVVRFVFPRLEPEKSPRPIAAAIARASAVDEPIGVLGLRPLEGAIGYYGKRRVISLRSESAARRFLESGNPPAPLLVLRARDFEALAPPLGLVPIERFRSGRRELVLARRPSVPPLGDGAP